jgi:hypothetical protein
MSEAPRPTLDIREDIETIIRNYPPLRESRPHLKIDVDPAGKVTLSGNVRTHVIERVLVDSTRLVEGVTAVDDGALYNDDEVLVEAGKLLPPGVYLTAVNGALALTGREPANTDALVEAVKAVTGVRAVTVKFYAAAQPTTA